MSTKCPMCGHAVRIVGSDEGTNHYEPVETDERSAGTDQSATNQSQSSSTGAAPHSGHTKYDDWWCECGMRVEDCDYLRDNLRAQRRNRPVVRLSEGTDR